MARGAGGWAWLQDWLAAWPQACLESLRGVSTTAVLSLLAVLTGYGWVLKSRFGPPTYTLMGFLIVWWFVGLAAIWGGAARWVQPRPPLRVMANAVLWHATLALALWGLFSWLAFFEGLQYKNPGVRGVWLSLELWLVATLMGGVTVAAARRLPIWLVLAGSVAGAVWMGAGVILAIFFT